MANIIILEGLSRTGKSTIANELGNRFGFKSISIKNKMPEFIKNYHEFYHGIHVLANEMYKAFPEETFILDRSFLSEVVYSKFFNRESFACKDDLIADMLMDHNFVLVYLSNNYERYIQRGPKDRIVFTEREFQDQKDSFDWYFNKYENDKDSESWHKKFIEIDTTETSIEESIQIITKHLEENQIIKKENKYEN
jgi:thymidylate kinase